MSRLGVVDYYNGKSIFITGGTGFMGIVLVESLLRTCPGIQTLYLLIRAKKGLSVEERLKAYVKSEVFDKIREVSPERLLKLRPVAGDGASDHLGISAGDREELRRECQIIFHCAATVRFDQFIRDAVEINVTGTLKMLQLAETMKKLEVFVHVSTAYCRDYLDVLEEKLYPTKHRPQDIVELVRSLDDVSLKAIEQQLIQPLPHTYAYTKELTEELIRQYAGKFTIVVARPSIVVSAYEHPYPGWINNLNGPTGLQVAAAKGVYRIVHTLKDVSPDVMPVDVAVNAVILLAYFTGLEQPEDVRVCNITNSSLNTLSWADMITFWNTYIHEYPYSVCLWYPKVTSTESLLMYRVQTLLMQWLPAVFLDTLLTIFRRKPFMIKVQKRLHSGITLLNLYLTRNWEFRNDYFLSLRDRLSLQEREMFFTEYDNIDFIELVKNFVQGARKYCMKEPTSTLPKAKRQLKFLYMLHIVCQAFFWMWILNIIYYYLRDYITVSLF